MNILKICILSFSSLAVLFVSTKILGNKQMSELNMFDYINGITIGSIAAEMATSLENDFWYPVIAMAVYTLVLYILARITEKKVGLRRFFSGKSIILMENGKIYQRNFSIAKLDITEFLTQCRVSGYFNLDDIDTAILEQNGKISILPKSSARPVNTQDLNLAVNNEKIAVNVILDGNVMLENLRRTGNDIEWLRHELKKQNINSENEVFLAICNTADNSLSLYKKVSNAPENDVFQ